MEAIGVAQSKATTGVIAMGIAETISRCTFSWAGDYIKPNILYAYVVFAVLICIVHGMAILATTFTHLMLYSIGLYAK